ncbi:hypothetical protein [Thiolapillus sp.]|uniref:hypothetical protein n=1 Tax=Thiolapillus sp. TaxID=2017437 RepID=UPI0025F81D82|nr:hypothetical protein [Thiolapillus sp.]
MCLRPRDRFWDIPVPKIDSAFDNLFVPQPSWSPSTTQQLRKLVAAPYLSPNDWTPRLDAYFASPLALCARRVSSAASRLLGSTSLRFALHGWQRWQFVHDRLDELPAQLVEFALQPQFAGLDLATEQTFGSKHFVLFADMQALVGVFENMLAGTLCTVVIFLCQLFGSFQQGFFQVTDQLFLCHDFSLPFPCLCALCPVHFCPAR